MDKRQEKFLDEVLWGLKMQVHQMIAISFVRKDDIHEVYSSLANLLKEENITPIIQLSYQEQNRYLIMLSFQPNWGFIIKHRSDTWDYITVIEELREILYG
jgi:hypothetical protein